MQSGDDSSRLIEIVQESGGRRFALVTLGSRRARIKAGLPTGPVVGLVGKIAVVAAAIIATVAVLNSDRGVPLAALILVGFVVFFQYVTTRTRFGRHIYAVGGNAEAARRAGISVSAIRVAVFAIASSMAAIGGIMASSRLLAVNQSSGGSDLLLLAIAGPVIGARACSAAAGRCGARCWARWSSARSPTAWTSWRSSRPTSSWSPAGSSSPR